MRNKPADAFIWTAHTVTVSGIKDRPVLTTKPCTGRHKVAEIASGGETIDVAQFHNMIPRKDMLANRKTQMVRHVTWGMERGYSPILSDNLIAI